MEPSESSAFDPLAERFHAKPFFWIFYSKKSFRREIRKPFYGLVRNLNCFGLKPNSFVFDDET